ncbi:MAG: IS110 family transposase [Chitinophagaceae bacterium]|nr:IS110 family transposase [Chitinophagaceae bacterium]
MSVKKSQKVEIVNAHACGIDIGSRSHFVSIGQGKDDVKEFGVYTEDHFALIAYLKENHIESIAMESTGNYWQTLFSALQIAGFEVMLVCGNQTKNVKGRKTDVQDCQWIQKLHSLGLLSNSFLPSEFVAQLRIYSRQRDGYIKVQARIINQIQRDLRLMNIRLDVALRDVTSKSGCLIIEAILQGERDAETLADLVDYRVKKSKAEIAMSLKGNWNSGYLFVLRQHFQEYKTNISLIRECELEIEKIMSENLRNNEIDVSDFKGQSKALKKNKNTPEIDFQKYSFQYFGGVDLFAIEGVNQNTVLTILSEVGNDIFKFPTAKAFASWLHLSPNQKVSGGRVISNGTKRGSNFLSQALKSSANVIGNMKNNFLSNFFKRICFKKGRKEAIAATARKLAVIIWNMLTRYQSYQPMNTEIVIDKIKKRKIKEIEKMIQKYKITQNEIVLN